MLRLAVISRARGPAGFVGRSHAHPFHELGHVVEGRAIWTVGARRVAVNAGEVLWVPAGVTHAEESVRGKTTRLAWVGFDFETEVVLPRMRRRLGGLGERGEVTRLYETVQREQAAAALGARERATLALRELLILYARAGAELEPGTGGEAGRGGAAGSRAALLAGAVAHSLQENLAAPLGVVALARYHGVTPSYLARLFKRERGVGPRAFLIAARVARARERLRTSDAPLKAIAAECGFVDAAHLSHAFKAATGVSPARWRRGEAGEGKSPMTKVQ